MSAANVHLLQGFQDAVGICLCNKEELVGESCDIKMDQKYVQPVRMVKTRKKNVSTVNVDLGNFCTSIIHTEIQQTD